MAVTKSTQTTCRYMDGSGQATQGLRSMGGLHK